MHSIVNAREQSYPNKLKTIYLMHQKPFPKPMTDLSAIPFPVKEINVRGKWPLLWFKKIKEFCDQCTEPITILWDEDDRFEYHYTELVVNALTNNQATVTWNWENNFVTNFGIFKKKHFFPLI